MEREPGLTNSRPLSSRRYAFVDLLRGTALVVMIETHVVNAYLPSDQRGGEFFFWLAFVNGLVAPAFLYSSGFSLILQVRRDWDGWLRFSRPMWLNLRRLGFITLVAYCIHLQRYRLSEYLESKTPDLWARTLQVDILQCIVASLMIVQALLFLMRKRSLFAWGAGFLAAVVALLTPWMWNQDFRPSVPLAFALFLNPHGISLFPLFPWLCFVLSGSLAAHHFLDAVEQTHEIRHMKNVFVIGALMIAGALAAAAIPFSLPGRESFYTTSPLFVLIRLGSVLVISALLYGLEKFLHFIPSWIQMAGQQSLLVYGFHLLLIFGVLRGKHLGPVIGLEFGYTACFAISGAVILLMLWLAKQWHRLKKNYPGHVRLAQAVIVSVAVGAFLVL